MAAEEIVGVVFGVLVVVWGFRRGSLSRDGAVAASIVGLVTALAGLPFTFVLYYFFISSSIITKIGSKRKAKIEDNHVVGGGRTAIQVLANGLTGTIAAALYLLYFKELTVCWTKVPSACALISAFIGHYACCNGDTWASELGVLSPTKPRLITTWAIVPAGTNGGLSLLGTAASCAGGLSLGLVMYLTFLLTGSNCEQQYVVIGLGLLGGFVGSMIDSLLGATLQVSYWSAKKQKIIATREADATLVSGLDVLDNHQVNFVSSLITALLFAAISPILFQ